MHQCSSDLIWLKALVRNVFVYLFKHVVTSVWEVFPGISKPSKITATLPFSMTQQLELIVQTSSSSDLFISWWYEQGEHKGGVKRTAAITWKRGRRGVKSYHPWVWFLFHTASLKIWKKTWHTKRSWRRIKCPSIFACYSQPHCFVLWQHLVEIKFTESETIRRITSFASLLPSSYSCFLFLLFCLSCEPFPVTWWSEIEHRNMEKEVGGGIGEECSVFPSVRTFVFITFF